MPVVRTDGGRSVYGHVITKFSGMGRFTYPWCFAGARIFPPQYAPLRSRILSTFSFFIKVQFMVIIQDNSFFTIKSASVNISLDDLHSLLMCIIRHINISLRTSKELI